MNSFLLPPVLLLLAASVSPHAAARPTFCVGDITYAANSTYEANLRRLEAVLLAEVSTSKSSYTYRAAGLWPNRVQASSVCRRRDDGSYVLIGMVCDDVVGACRVDTQDEHEGPYSYCASCVAGAFRKLESACPYHKDAYFSDGNCTLELSEVRLFGTESVYYGGNIMKQIFASGLIFQVIGFGWLFFLALQEWRGRKRGTAVLSTPLIPGDQ